MSKVYILIRQSGVHGITGYRETIGVYSQSKDAEAEKSLHQKYDTGNNTYSVKEFKVQ